MAILQNRYVTILWQALAALAARIVAEKRWSTHIATYQERVPIKP